MPMRRGTSTQSGGRRGLGLPLGIPAPHELFDPPLQLHARHQDAPAAFHAGDPNIGAQPDNLPLIAATRVRLARADDVADKQFDDGHSYVIIINLGPAELPALVPRPRS